MFGWIRRRPTSIAFPSHYLQTAKRAPGPPCELTLAGTREEGSWFRLAYVWTDNLDHQEADRLDSRVRAFIACAIPDAAGAASLACQGGPPHGQRPAWFVEGGPIPVSLVHGSFDVDRKTCYVTVGPIDSPAPMLDSRGVPVLDSRGLPVLDPVGRGETDAQGEIAVRLAAGFQSRFSQIRV